MWAVVVVGTAVSVFFVATDDSAKDTHAERLQAILCRGHLGCAADILKNGENGGVNMFGDQQRVGHGQYRSSIDNDHAEFFAKHGE